LLPLAEEAIALAAAMRRVRNVLIIGSSSDRANDRLRAIKHARADRRTARSAEEFITQPLRLEQLRRRTFIPVTGYRAPKGKLQFISSLQLFLQAGDITFAKEPGDVPDHWPARFPLAWIDEKRRDCSDRAMRATRSAGSCF
jgi:hypothetical protein